MNIGVTNRCLFRLIFFALVYACLGGATALFAQADSCERPGGRRGDGDDLKCRMGILLEKSQTFLEKTKARTDEQCATGGGCERLKKSMEKAQAKSHRATNAHNRSTAQEYEDLTVKGNGKRKKKGGGNSGGGGQTAEDQQNEDEEPQPDPAVGEDLANELDEAITTVDDANSALDEEPTSQQVPLALSQSTGKFEANYGYNRSERTGPVIAMAAFVAFRLSHTLAEVSQNFCDQTVVVGGFGGNFSSGCATFFWTGQLFETIHETLGFLDDDIDSAEIEGAYERAGQVYDKVSELQVTVGGTDQDIAVLRSDLASHDTGVRDLLADVMAEVRANQQQMKKVIAVQRQIIRLLLQPEGKRSVNPAVLTCTGDNCPLVLDCPGNECVSPVK
jgi:hypothetical protein